MLLLCLVVQLVKRNDWTHEILQIFEHSLAFSTQVPFLYFRALHHQSLPFGRQSQQQADPHAESPTTSRLSLFAVAQSDPRSYPPVTLSAREMGGESAQQDPAEGIEMSDHIDIRVLAIPTTTRTGAT